MTQQQSIKITKLFVKNYRGIGSEGLEIDIDDMVVLVGPNNSGKSTILKAFQLVTTADTKIYIDDFSDKKPEVKPEIEVWTKVIDKASVHIDAEKWINCEGIVREKWTWNNPGESATRLGFRVDLDGGRWAITGEDPQAPFSNDGGAPAYRPTPTYISPFEQLDKQVDEIKKVISLDVYESVKAAKKKDPSYETIQRDVNSLQATIRDEAKEKENELANELGVILNKLFPDTKVTLNIPENSPDLLSSYAIPKEIELRINDLSLENQGSGMQRMLMWSVFKMLASKQKKAQKANKKKLVSEETSSTESVARRTKVLLLDEPEICLHPESIRQAKETLYDLASTGDWQVMITTHSPIFIDLSKDNTNIIRVQKEEKKVSLYKTSDADLSEVEKEQVKMLNIFDPYFAEFFFAKRTIVVEGDTEYTVFRKIIESDKDNYKDIQIIRARGKYTIIPIIKILKKWGKDFSVLHDSDVIGNNAWPANEQILDLTNGISSIRHLACKKNFESAMFGKEKEAVKDKPFNAYKKLSDSDILSRSKALLDYLCNKRNRLDSELLDRVIEYKNIDELKSFVNI